MMKGGDPMRGDSLFGQGRHCRGPVAVRVADKRHIVAPGQATGQGMNANSIAVVGGMGQASGDDQDAAARTIVHDPRSSPPGSLDS